ncbi:Concanavalin A-like lectin protein kinase family protein [Hibiscus syriacus]|uniref:Concanavalin A-like lectin protein kinase family protein n=1 Tax=Hibiscus syriacus TaxID=106335 RepID=A0A6A2Z4N3_HIBSY|nr:Concanavalin A-like lectin protein kinase family protein [Hibiscus syriacus]
MAGATTKIHWDHRSLVFDSRVFDLPDYLGSNSSDMEFEFLEDGDEEDPGICNDNEEDEEEEPKANEGESDGNRERFWEIQNHLLQATLCRSSSLESRIRNAVEEALKEIGRETTVCGCGKSLTAEHCRNCLMREVFSRLQNAGFDAAVCHSKWRSSPHIPSEHSFLDVIENSRKRDVRIVIELNFRAEFEMARASEDYNRLVQRLPEVFVGKVERLNNVIKILCLAAKKCMKEKGMHMGPWRKQRYMQAKWLKSRERNSSTKLLPVWEVPAICRSIRLLC